MTAPLSTIIHAHQDAYDRSKRRSAGTQAIIARNELIRRELRSGTPADVLAARYKIGITTVGKLGTPANKENEA